MIPPNNSENRERLARLVVDETDDIDEVYNLAALALEMQYQNRLGNDDGQEAFENDFDLYGNYPGEQSWVRE